MKRFLLLTAFILIYSFAFSQASGSVDLGSEITNGITTNGCMAGCVPAYCSSTGTSNHSVQTMQLTITGIPAGNSAEITISTIACGSASGLDGSDGIFVNGTEVIATGGNDEVNETVCVAGGADILVELVANRRDEVVNVTWDSGPTDPAGCFGSVLPVTLTYFEAEKVSENRVALNWQTASEIDNEHFIVEHSIDGRAFEDIGKVDGNGNSCLLYTSPSPRDATLSRMPSSA